MLEILLIRPGATLFDDECRIKGALDIPLSTTGHLQAQQLAERLQQVKLDCLYVAPAESAKQTAAKICEYNFCRCKPVDSLRNLDHGLWQGKLVAEVKRLQPKVYRQFQDHPTAVCPPGGETVIAAANRIQSQIEKLMKRHRDGRIGIVVPQPLAAIVGAVLLGKPILDFWQCEMDFGTYEVLRLETRARSLELVES